MVSDVLRGGKDSKGESGEEVARRYPPQDGPQLPPRVVTKVPRDILQLRDVVFTELEACGNHMIIM